jgi:AcrR family transcriptional regulator
MPRRSAADAAATARHVLAVARDVFAADGYAAVSLDEIARRAGVTRGAIYHHYGDKTGLFAAVAADAHAAVAAHVVAAAEGHATPAAQLRAGSHAFLEAITAGDVARLLLVEAPAALGWSRWRDMDAAAGGRELRDAISAVGTVDLDDVDAATQLLSGAMNEAALWLAERPADTAARRSAHAVLDRLLDALAP